MNTRSPFLKLHTILVFAFLYAPILVLVIFSFNAGKQTAVWDGFTLAWYTKLFKNELIWASVKNSLIIAGMTTATATIIGTAAALALSRYQFRGDSWLRNLLYLPIIIPEIVMGAALVTFFGVVQFKLSLWTVILAHLAFSVPYVALVVRARLTGWDNSLEEAAQDLGATPFQTFFRVTLPLIMPGILSAALLVFTISIDDYVITSFVAGVGSTTLPIQIYSMLKVNVTPEVNAVCTVLLVFTIILIVLSQHLLKKSKTS
jgi:spermidine/putrescine transport system permease protein